MGTVYLILRTPLEFQQSISKELPTEQGSFSSGPERKHYSFSQEISIKQVGSMITTSVQYMEEVMAILFRTIEANIEGELHLLSESINNVVVVTYSVLSTVLDLLMRIPSIHFLINVVCVWIKLWIFYGVYKFIRHPLWCLRRIFWMIMFACFGQLRFFIRVLRDPRVHAASRFPE